MGKTQLLTRKTSSDYSKCSALQLLMGPRRCVFVLLVTSIVISSRPSSSITGRLLIHKVISPVLRGGGRHHPPPPPAPLNPCPCFCQTEETVGRQKKNRRWIANVKRLHVIHDKKQEPRPLVVGRRYRCLFSHSLSAITRLFFIISLPLVHLSFHPPLPNPPKKSIIQRSFCESSRLFTLPRPSFILALRRPSVILAPPPVTWPRSPAAPASASGPSPPQSGRPRSPAPQTGSELEAAVGGRGRGEEGAGDKVLSKRSQGRTHFALILRRQDADVRTHIHSHAHTLFLYIRENFCQVAERQKLGSEARLVSAGERKSLRRQMGKSKEKI